MDQVAFISNVLCQHAEEVSFLWETRSHAVSSWNYDLKELIELDQQLEANIDGLKCASKYAWDILLEFYDFDTADELFATTVFALRTHQFDKLAPILAKIEGDRDGLPGIISAFGWCDFDIVRERIAAFIRSDSSVLRYLGMSAISVHRMDSKEMIDLGLQDTDPLVRSRALRLAGELGLVDKLPCILESLSAEDQDCLFWASWSAILLGERKKSLEILDQFSSQKSWYGEQSTDLMLRALPLPHGAHWLKDKIDQHGLCRSYIKGIGALGSTVWIPNLIEYMYDHQWARLAAYALTLITGADLDFLDCDTDPPDDVESRLNDNPDSEEVDMDDDEDLIWPKVKELTEWWSKQQQHYDRQKAYLNGEVKTEVGFINNLQFGRQAHRKAAATEFALLSATQLLYPVEAPGFRQRKEMYDI